MGFLENEYTMWIYDWQSVKASSFYYARNCVTLFKALRLSKCSFMRWLIFDELNMLNIITVIVISPLFIFVKSTVLLWQGVKSWGDQNDSYWLIFIESKFKNGKFF